MSFTRYASHTFIGQALSAISSLLLGVVTARLLGPEARGAYSLFFTNAGLITTALYFGITQANVYFLNKRNVPITTIIGNCIIVFLLQLLLFSSLLTLSQKLPNINEQLQLEGRLTIFWLLCSGLIAETSLTGLVLGRQKFKLYAAYSSLNTFLILLATIATFALGYTLEEVIFVRITTFIAILSIYLLTFAKSEKFSKPLISFSTLASQLSFGSKSYTQNLLGLVNYKVYIYFLATLSTPLSVGYFSIAILFSEIVRFIPNTLGTVLFPHLTKFECETSANKFFTQVLKVTLVITSVLALLVIPFCSKILTLVFGNDYLEAATLTRYLICGSAIGSVYQVTTRFFTSKHKQKFSIYSLLISITLGAFICLKYIPEYGFEVAGIAFLVANSVCAFCMLLFSKKLIKCTLSELLIPTSSDIKLITTRIRSIVNK